MDQKKNQGQQSDRPRGQGHQTHEESGTTCRPPARKAVRKGAATRGSNLGGGISNRDVDRDLMEEQDEMADRDRQSER